MNNNQIIIGIVVLALLAVGGFLFIQSNKTATAPTDNTSVNMTAAPDTSAPSSVPDSTNSAAQGAVKEFTVTGSNFKFAPATLTVNQGDTVKITFQSAGGMHNFMLPDFNVQSKTINSGSDTVTFTADKKGSFEYFCSVGNHRAMGMKGTLTVQ